MTDAQRTNLDSAMRLAANRVGWAGATKDIPYELNEAYVTELSLIIVANPELFSEITVANARRELADEPNQPLEDYKFGAMVGDFVREAGHQALDVGRSVAAVGEGVKNTLTTTKWLIPVAAVVAVVVLLSSFARRTGATR